MSGINLSKYINQKDRTNLPNFLFALVVGVICFIIAILAAPRGDITGSTILAILGSVNLAVAYKFRSVIK